MKDRALVLDEIASALAGRPRGLFIAFEGGDGSGKSTQASLLAGELEARGARALFTHEPGATELGQELRRHVMHGPADVDDRTEALLYAADRAYHVATVVRPALNQGITVFTDRYIDSSVAYQGVGRGLGAEEIKKLSLWATEGLTPDAVLLYSVDPTVGLERIGGKLDRLESAGGEFHERVARYCQDLANDNLGHYRVIDGTPDVDSVFEETVTAVAELVLEAGP